MRGNDIYIFQQAADNVCSGAGKAQRFCEAGIKNG